METKLKLASGGEIMSKVYMYERIERYNGLKPVYKSYFGVKNGNNFNPIINDLVCSGLIHTNAFNIIEL